MPNMTLSNTQAQPNDSWGTACLPFVKESTPTIIPTKPDEAKPIAVPAPPPLRKPTPEEKPHTPPESDPCRRYSTCEINSKIF